MKRTVFIVACFLILTSISFTARSQGNTGEETQRQFIDNVALPAIRTIIEALDVQNAPVPAELRELVDSANDPDAFYSLAASYFGAGWQERLSRDAASVKSPEEALLVRTRIYLASLTANAERIAKTSPLSAEEIRSLASNLSRQSQYLKTADSRSIFIDTLRHAESAIFPPELGLDLPSFRNDVRTLLTDTDDAISILVEGWAVDTLEDDLHDLQTRLTSVGNTQELTAWLARFDAFASRILSHAVPASQETLEGDAEALLTTLETYLSTLEKNGMAPPGLKEEVSILKSKLRNDMTKTDFEMFLRDLEILLMGVSARFQISASSSS